MREEAWPQVRDADEMHDALMVLGFVTADEVAANPGWDELAAGTGEGAARARASTSATALVDRRRTPAAVRRRCIPTRPMQPPIDAPAEYAAQAWTRDDALRRTRAPRLGGLGPVTVDALAQSLGVDASDDRHALLR